MKWKEKKIDKGSAEQGSLGEPHLADQWESSRSTGLKERERTLHDTNCDLFIKRRWQLTSSGNRIFARAANNNFLFSVAKHEGRGGAAGMCASQSQEREACSSHKFAEFFRLSGWVESLGWTRIADSGWQDEVCKTNHQLLFWWSVQQPHPCESFTNSV